MQTQEQARSYHRWRLWLGVAGFLLAAAYLFVLIPTGAAIGLGNRLSALTPWWWLQLPLALLLLGAGYRLLALPLHWLGGTSGRPEPG